MPGGALAAPVISFTVEDADPHTYDCVVYYRSTSGSQTWAGNDYWAATKTGCLPGPVTISLAAEATPGHLEPGVHDWGTYTFDIVVTEHDGAAQVDRYGYKEPYCLWVPATTPETPAREGHRVWTKVPEEEDQAEELRAMYWLNHQWNQTPSDVELVVVDPTLSERPPSYVASAAERALGVMHGGADADNDGEPDGIGVYTFADDDPSGLWRVVWTASDAVGPKTQHRRTHDEQRMLVANQATPRGPKRPLFTLWNADPDWAFVSAGILDNAWISYWLNTRHNIRYEVYGESVEIVMALTGVYAKLTPAQMALAKSHLVVWSWTREGYLDAWLSGTGYGGTVCRFGTPKYPDLCFIARGEWEDWAGGVEDGAARMSFYTHLYPHELCHAAGLEDEVPDGNSDSGCIMRGKPTFPRWMQNWDLQDPWAPHAGPHAKRVTSHLGGAAR